MHSTHVSKNSRITSSRLVGSANTRHVLIGVMTLVVSSAGALGAVVPLGAAASFAVLGGSTVANTGPTLVFGNVGVSPGMAVTGFPPGTVTSGSIRLNDSIASQAHADAVTTSNYLAGLPVTQTLTGQDLGGLKLGPGVYFFASSAQLTGILTLDGEGQADPLFVFQIGTTLTTASLASVVTIDGATSADAFFQVGTSATLGAGTAFEGTIIASASDTLAAGATLDGRAIALNGAVTLDTNSVAIPATPVVPEPSAAFVPAGLAASLLAGRRRRT